MAKDIKVQNVQESPVSQLEVAKPQLKAEEKVRFLEWFSVSVDRFKGLKAHHMNEVRAYFIGINIPDPATFSAYDDGMKIYGLEARE
jgi:ribosomal protein L5